MIHVLFVVVTMVLLLAAAFLSGSETAITGSSRAYLFHLAKKGDKRAKKVIELQEDMSLSIPTDGSCLTYLPIKEGQETSFWKVPT